MIGTLRKLLLPATLVAIALVAPSQAAASPLAVLRDCADSDFFEKKHSRADLKAALGQIQADLGEYGTCEQMIRAELRRQAPKARAAAKNAVDLDGDGVISPSERAAAAGKAGGAGKKGKNGKNGRDEDGTTVASALRSDDDDASGGTVAASTGGGGGSSLALILVVAALVCGAVGGGLWYAGKRNPAIGNALRRVPLPFRNS